MHAFQGAMVRVLEHLQLRGMLRKVPVLLVHGMGERFQLGRPENMTSFGWVIKMRASVTLSLKESC